MDDTLRAGDGLEVRMPGDEVRLSDEMASTLSLEAGGGHSRDEIGAAVQDRFGRGDGPRVENVESIPVHVLGELVVLLDAGGCQDLDAAVRTASAAGDGGADTALLHTVAEDLCGELAERHHMP
jgi:hypothetical protein